MGIVCAHGGAAPARAGADERAILATRWPCRPGRWGRLHGRSMQRVARAAAAPVAGGQLGIGLCACACVSRWSPPAVPCAVTARTPAARGDAAPGAAGRGGRASGAGGGDTGGGPRARHRSTRRRRRVHAHAPLHVAAGRGALLRELSRGQPAGSRRAGTALAAPGAEHIVEAHRNRPRTLAGAALDGELSVAGADGGEQETGGGGA
eukprot:scaffold24448_cov101-Isochrysis_galbana.AAC.2